MSELLFLDFLVIMSIGCWLGNQFYLPGDRWSPYIEPQGIMPCVKCQCAQVVRRGRIQLQGRVVCQNIKKECPKTSCPNPYLPLKACCKICPGQEDVFRETQMEDKGPPANIPLRPSLDEFEPSTKDMTALLVGGGGLGRSQGERHVKTKAVAMIHVTVSPSNVLKYALRFAKLKHPAMLRITDGYGTVLVEHRLPMQAYRTASIYGEIPNLRRDYVEYITSSNSRVIITTAKYRRGELFGQLKENALARVATFEALLGSDRSRGTGALVTMFYDTSTHIASFTVQLAGERRPRTKPMDFVVTFEKSTEIRYQHVLSLSPSRRQIVGQINVDSRISKQIARGKINVRVTSQNGHTLIGLLRPRLLRTGFVSLLPNLERVQGYVLASLEEDGAIKYKVSLDIHTKVGLILERQAHGKDKWNRVFNLGSFVPSSDSGMQEIRKHKRLRARDTSIVLSGQIRLKISYNDRTEYSYFQPLPNEVDYTFYAQHQLLLPPQLACPGRAHMFAALRPDCSIKYYITFQGTDYDSDELFILSFATKQTGVVEKELREPWGQFRKLSNDLYQQLGENGIPVRIDVSSEMCDSYKAQIKIPNHCWGKSPTLLKPKPSLGNDPETEDLRIFRCYYDNRFYQHAQSWIPDDGSSCVTCMCNRGSVHCDEVLCPVNSCGHTVIKPGECCPSCDEDNETERQFVGSCYYDGDKRWHPVGTYWHPFVPPFGYSKCAVCNCAAGTLEVNCTRLPCPELSCPKHQQIRVNRDDCCQVCVGTGNDVFDEDSARNVISPIKPRTVKDCVLGGQQYSHGDKWHPYLFPFGEMKCYTCSCNNGKTKCRRKKCPQLDCNVQYRPSGECCPVCSGSKSVGL